MSESLNINMATMLDQMTPEMRTLMLDILQKGQAAAAGKTARQEQQDKDYSSLEKRMYPVSTAGKTSLPKKCTPKCMGVCTRISQAGWLHGAIFPRWSICSAKKRKRLERQT